ncbi:MAG: hypothetical protein OXE77_08630 [Flavobacteriaceae bacterium]|nr:hypothetical protein [Flavobacteriaceae bacterium]MCY4267280.1 hypothetical protein [Flavobacteriaceae bacterium]
MGSTEFKKLLFKTAFCVIVCDGEIDDLEIQELSRIDKNTSYFNDIDLSKELRELIISFKKTGKKVINELFEAIRKQKLDITQELLLLEITIRIMNSDKRVDDNEIQFLNTLRSKLDVYNEVISERFGYTPLFKQYTFDDTKTVSKLSNLTKEFNIPDIPDFKGITIKR